MGFGYAGTEYVGAKPVTYAAAPLVEGTAGTDTCSYNAFGQTSNGFSVGAGTNTTTTCNHAATGTGAAVTNASIQLIANNPGVVLATTQSCTAGQFLVAYGLTAVTAINGQVLQAVSCTGTTFTGLFVAGATPALVAPTAVTGTITPNFVLLKMNQQAGDQGVATARLTGTAGIICNNVAPSYQFCADYGQGTSAATPSGVDTTGAEYLGGVYASAKTNVIASAATIAPVGMVTHISGTATISTITPPAAFTSTTSGCIDFITDAISGFTTGGNITSPAITAVANTPYHACWDGTAWFIR